MLKCILWVLQAEGEFLQFFTLYCLIAMAEIWESHEKMHATVGNAIINHPPLPLHGLLLTHV